MKLPANLYNYCKAYKGYFFAWEDDGDVLAVPGGKTICYAPYFFELLELLTPQGAPRLGTLLLSIVATSGDADDMLPMAEEIIRQNYIDLHQNMDADSELHTLNVAFNFLAKLRSLPAQYKSGTRRMQVLQTIFEGSHNVIAARKIKAIVAEYKQPSPKLFGSEQLSLGILAADLKPLEVLNSRYANREALLAKLASVPLIEDAPLQLDRPAIEAGAPEDFIEALEAKTDTFHVGSLVRRIWSGLAIPFHSNHPSVQPLGGVSDLSNRGGLDKLLLSEHANDELLFLSRLANNEALYINRETPPETDKLQRIILIDSSLQAWGTPRAIAFALMLAIARHPKTDIVCSGFTVGDTYSSVLFDTIDEIVAGLQSLDASVNAAQGLEAFLKSRSERRKHEVILISSPQGYRQPAVQSIIAEWVAEIAFCITASEAGEVVVYRRRSRGFGQHQTFTLPLAELWKAPPTAPRPMPPATHQAAVPADYPILFPAPTDFKALLTAADGQTFAITKEKAVLRRWKSQTKWPFKGWAFVYDKLPGGECRYEIGLSSKGEYLLLCNVVSRRDVLVINLNTRMAATTHIDGYITKRATPKFRFWNDSFVLQEHSGAWKLELVRDTDPDGAFTLRFAQADIPSAINYTLVGTDSENHIFDRTVATNSGTVLKNIKRVSITYAHVLLINQHELLAGNERTIIFQQTVANSGWIPANHIAANKFEFPDGSSITTNRNGMLVLESSNKAIAKIYVPSVLDAPLGVATKKDYAGTDFYNPEIVPEEGRMSPGEFYDNYIEAFTAHIVKHATSVKA